MRQVFKDDNNYFEIGIIDNLGDFVTGLEVAYEITKSEDDSLITGGTASENNGVYYFEYSFTDVGDYRLKYITPENYDNGFEKIIVIDNYIIDIDNSLNIINDGINDISATMSYVIDTIENVNVSVNNISATISLIESEVNDISTSIDEHRSQTEERIKFILGLSQQNFKIVDQVYNSDNLLLSSTIKIYANSTDLDNDVSPINIYKMSASYDAVGRITSYKVVEF